MYLTILPRPVLIQTNTAEYDYDGVAGGKTDVGEYTTTIDGKTIGLIGDHMNNYVFITLPGKSTINAAPAIKAAKAVTKITTAHDPDSAVVYTAQDGIQEVTPVAPIADEELYERTVDMRTTVPGDVLSYVRKWVSFQERWTEVLPAIPVYSNIYFDFYTSALQDYKITSGITWADAIVGAYLGEPRPEEPEQNSTLAAALSAITGE